MEETTEKSTEKSTTTKLPIIELPTIDSLLTLSPHERRAILNAERKRQSIARDGKLCHNCGIIFNSRTGPRNYTDRVEGEGVLEGGWFCSWCVEQWEERGEVRSLSHMECSPWCAGKKE